MDVPHHWQVTKSDPILQRSFPQAHGREPLLPTSCGHQSSTAARRRQHLECRCWWSEILSPVLNRLRLQGHPELTPHTTPQLRTVLRRLLVGRGQACLDLVQVVGEDVTFACISRGSGRRAF